MKTTLWMTLAVAGLTSLAAAPAPGRVPDALPSSAAAELRASLEAAARHPRHVWRDTPPLDAEGLVNAFVEIPAGERAKWEFDMRANERAIDRVLPADLGGYPVNYGFVPQTVFHDGDPFDALVLGPPLQGGRLVRGAIAGLLIMEDENGIDSKVVLSPVDADGQPLHRLNASARERIAGFFARYKRHEPDGFSKVSGWGTVEEGRAHVEVAHAFFLRCREPGAGPCRARR